MAGTPLAITTVTVTRMPASMALAMGHRSAGRGREAAGDTGGGGGHRLLHCVEHRQARAGPATLVGKENHASAGWHGYRA